MGHGHSLAVDSTEADNKVGDTQVDGSPAGDTPVDAPLAAVIPADDALHWGGENQEVWNPAGGRPAVVNLEGARLLVGSQYRGAAQPQDD